MMKNKKIIASFELTLMIVSMFAFAHGVYLTEGSFEKLKEKYIAEKNQSPIDAQQSQSNLLSIAGFILNKIKEPIIPVVSAQETGCCSLVDTGEKCVTTTRNICSGQFAEGSICDTTSFCRKGCCFDENTGIYDSNVLESECPVSWVNDPNCNLPGARLGCCILGDTSFFETEGQCEVRTLSFAQGSNPIVDWRGDMSGTQCLMLSATQNEGACVSQSGDCVFETEAQCYSHNGNFNENFLCTSPSLDTNCERTSQTTCVDGKDGVYFIDSCGNRANIYDLDRVNDSTYWDTLLSPEEICGDNDMTASVNSEACGNCNRFMGSTCDSASENNFNVRLGDFYCKDTSCMLGGVKYKNGESWCAYDGKIGDGDDVVGSRHWKYVCSQGEINIEPCADYRNQICVQSNTDSSSGTTEFRNAACVANNWRECVTLNSAEGPGECADTLNCMVQTVNIADHFKFDMCVPKYPGGFSLTNERYQKSAEGICGMATQTCTVVYAPNTWGGCHVAANEGCLHPEFYEQMNNLCRKLGDCGAEVNVIGEYERGDNMASRLGSSAILSLINLAKPVPGQFASVEDYSKYLGSTGQWVNPEEAPGSEGSDNITSAASSISTGIGAIGYAAGIYAEFISGNLETLSLKELSSLKDLSTIAESGSAGSSVAAYSGAAMGAAAGFYVGSMLAKQMGLSPGGSMLMAVGGAMLGGQLAYTYMTTGLAMGPVGWIGVALIVISMFFAGAGCPSVDVTFTCKPWKAPSGGDDCKKCNDDPLRPCSEYRCNSLGAACGIVNKGTAQEMCESSRDDGKPPIISPQLGVLSQNEVYSDISESGLSITSVAGGCIDAYTPLV
ncbi:MAG: hypothetical protein OEL87_01755, partial [Nanoarchaeota archaeon]|nr:hypothetical protein [Nanoarchaeota archaeon]